MTWNLAETYKYLTKLSFEHKYANGYLRGCCAMWSGIHSIRLHGTTHRIAIFILTRCLCVKSYNKRYARARTTCLFKWRNSVHQNVLLQHWACSSCSASSPHALMSFMKFKAKTVYTQNVLFIVVLLQSSWLVYLYVQFSDYYTAIKYEAILRYGRLQKLLPCM